MKTSFESGVTSCCETPKTSAIAGMLALLALLLALCLVMAWRSYPGYSMFDCDISFLGDPRLNPTGWWFWSLGMGLAGIMLWPVTAWASRQMGELTAWQTPWRRKLVATGSVASRCACFGLLGLALIPQYRGFDPPHQFAGVFAFGGLYLTVLFWCAALWGTSLSLAKTLLLTLAACWGPVGFLVTQGYRFFAYGEVGRAIKARDQSMLLRFSFWEWMLFLCVTTCVILLVMLLPDQRNTRQPTTMIHSSEHRRLSP